MSKTIDMLQTQTKLKSLHGNTSEPKHKVVVGTCELEFFYFVDVSATLNEGFGVEINHNEYDLHDFIEMPTNNGQRTNKKTKEDEDNSTKIIRPWEELQLKRNRYGLVYEKGHDNIFIILIIVNPLHL